MVVISSPSIPSPFAPGASAGHGGPGRPLSRRFRLVDDQGAPHPVLDDHYETLEAAWGEALLTSVVAALISLLTSVAASGVGDPQSPSLLKEES